LQGISTAMSKKKPQKPSEGIRLNKFIAHAGICSRREADMHIKIGSVKVNNKVMTEMGYKVKPTDEVQFDGQRLKAEKPTYVLLNKPKGFLATTRDEKGRKTVMDLVAKATKARIVPVGRLDRPTTGLLLFTNDGDLAKKTHTTKHRRKKTLSRCARQKRKWAALAKHQGGYYS
jgi:23S rRNA pseudouridine2605 synthase